MPYIYKITNKINDKCYIGKTERTIEIRWREHLKNIYSLNEYDKPLYRAIRKYGIENFYIEKIEEVDASILNERESYWIEYFQSFKKGYNATSGGDGKRYLDYELISKMYNEIKNCSKIAQILDIDEHSVSRAIKSTGGIVLPGGRENLPASKIIHMYSLNDDYEQTFPSVQKAVEWCVEQGLCKAVNSGARSHIGACASGKRKTAYQHKWKYAE